jgi:hypothetical protein
LKIFNSQQHPKEDIGVLYFKEHGELTMLVEFFVLLAHPDQYEWHWLNGELYISRAIRPTKPEPEAELEDA